MAAGQSIPSETENWKRSRQALLVITTNWNSVPGRLWRLERSSETNGWRQVGESIPIVVGRKGLAWGSGLHSTNVVREPVKMEGDGRSPAGVFHLSSAFGSSDAAKAGWIRLNYVQLRTPIECVDDVNSRFYNSIVDGEKVPAHDWNSSEKMLAVGEQYRLGIFVDHNVNPAKPGGGSCIFLHIWQNAATGTSGCTAMTAADIESLLKWLDAAHHPILVQLPQAEYERQRDAWQLPAVR
jgi:L,D-peptidoglycan transpeptidase YkuD (ErfK/YbiS/YcfS/YnhG family)